MLNCIWYYQLPINFPAGIFPNLPRSRYFRPLAQLNLVQVKIYISSFSSHEDLSRPATCPILMILLIKTTQSRLKKYSIRIWRLPFDLQGDCQTLRGSLPKISRPNKKNWKNRRHLILYMATPTKLGQPYDNIIKIRLLLPRFRNCK